MIADTYVRERERERERERAEFSLLNKNNTFVNPKKIRKARVWPILTYEL